MLNDKIKLACLTDSPKLTTGFANVARMLLEGWHNHGFEVYSFGAMDMEPDMVGELPYSFWPSSPFDEMGHRTVALFLVNIQPDVIFIMFDPGNVDTFMEIIKALQDSGNLRKCPVVVYTPIEGVPIPGATAATISKIIERDGKVVLYSQKMIDLMNAQYPTLTPYLDWAHHGLDHAPFRKYSSDYRNYLRSLVKWTDNFVVGSVGVNKRTKGFDTIVYTARCLRDLGQDEGIKFYFHTGASPTMWGYNLVDLANNFGVADMFIFKPDEERDPGGNIHGVDRVSQGIHIPLDDTEIEKCLASLGFIDRVNMLDCYLDLSQVEGWGLPAHEAMKCGVPTISVHDMAIRDEIYDGGVLWLDHEPFRMWQTWHTGIKLVLVDPAKAAQAIIELKNSDIKEFWSTIAMDNANKYNWQETQEKFIRILSEVVESYDYS